jgi:hypothetical protein
MTLIINYSVVKPFVLGAIHQLLSTGTCLPVSYSKFLCRPVLSFVILPFVGRRHRKTSPSLRLVVKLMKLALKYCEVYNHVAFHRSRITW